MPRKPRIHYPGAVYHVMLRGNGGQDIFFDEADRNRFYSLLREGTQRFGYRIHAFCLMTNHLHLAIQVADVPLSRIVQNFGFRYTQYLNRKRQKAGHLFQGRYKALLVDADSYLLELVRYIHLNPIRTGMVEDPKAYPWSGHRAYLGIETLPWLTTNWVYGQFAPNTTVAIICYSRFVADGLHEVHRAEFHKGTFEGRALGEDAFVEKSLARAEQTMNRQLSIEGMIEVVCSVFGLTTGEITSRSRVRRISEARAVVALLVRETEGMMLVTLGKYLGQDLSSLSQAARRLELRVAEDSSLREKVKKVKKRIPICPFVRPDPDALCWPGR